jgi:single-strand DNA-binding protein
MNVNTVILAGRLTRDPKLRKTDGGTSVCEISLAINRKYTTAGGERRVDTCFVDIVFWGNRAEYVAESTKKGSTVFIEGRLELDRWESQDGQKRSRLRVVGDVFQRADKPEPDEAAEKMAEPSDPG